MNAISLTIIWPFFLSHPTNKNTPPFLQNQPLPTNPKKTAIFSEKTVMFFEKMAMFFKKTAIFFQKMAVNH